MDKSKLKNLASSRIDSRADEFISSGEKLLRMPEADAALRKLKR